MKIMDDQEKKNQGIVYLLINEAMPGYVKIGKLELIKTQVGGRLIIM